MGRPPSNGGPSFRFNSVEVAEMDTILQAHNLAMPAREALEALAEKFSLSAERSGKFVVQMKQVWHWFQNRRYALRAKAARAPETLNLSPLTQDDSTMVKSMPQAPQSQPSPQGPVIDVPEVPQSLLAPGSRNGADSNSMEFEAKSARDGAWYDVAMFRSYRSVEAVNPEVLVRFAGFGAEEDEWVDIGRLVRKRSLPCESSECVAVLQGDLILCFQEGKEQALYFDAHVLDAQRRRHDVRGCRCRFLVRYDHDQSEEIVPLRKVCRRPETDYRLQQLYASNESATTKQSKAGAVPRTDNTLRVYPPAEPMQKQHKKKDFSDVPVLSDASQTNLLAGTEIKAQQTKVADIVDAGTPGNSSAAQSNNSLQPQVMKIVSPGTTEISDADIVVEQPKVTEIIDGGDVESLNVAPRIGIQQQKVTEIVGDANVGNAHVPPVNVVPQSEVETSASLGSAGDANVGNAHVPPVNVIAQSEVEETSARLGSANIPPDNAVQ